MVGWVGWRKGYLSTFGRVSRRPMWWRVFGPFSLIEFQLGITLQFGMPYIRMFLFVVCGVERTTHLFLHCDVVSLVA